MGVTLLGPVRVDGAAALTRRERVVLSVLAVRRRESVSPDQLADALWGELPPPTWPKQVQMCVARLRKALGASMIETTRSGYRLMLAPDELDVHRFEQLVDRGRVLAATGEPDRAAATFSRALGLWNGRPLPDLDGWPPGHVEVHRLEELRRAAEEDLLDARLHAGEHRHVVADAEALVAEAPLRERRWAMLALAQYRCGRQGDALRTLRRARSTLVSELGVDPGNELVELESAILRQDPELLTRPEPPAIADACPYQGLAPFDVDDAATFFGRDTDVAACVERLRASPLLVVAGPSGCGKSSLVRAGLVPALRAASRSVVVLTPGTNPEAALAAAMSASGNGSVLVIDQFEELFALGHPTDVARSFIDAVIRYALERDAVVVTIRVDHLGGLAVDAAASRLAEQGLHLVSPLSGDALRDAIEQPARQAGLRLQDGLTDLLMRDSEGEPGALPLLSHALVETWRRRDGHVLTVEGYRATGGISGAVARSAERLYESLTPDQRPLLRSVLMRLVGSLDGDPVRWRVPSRSLLGDAGRERLVMLLVRSRLVTSHADTFELAHEALARAWPRLASWLEDDTAGQRILRHLSMSADEWDSLGRPRSELYRGARLDTALEWRHATSPDLNEVERSFLDASAQHAATESRAVVERARRDARQNKRLRVSLVAAVLLVVVSATSGVIAIRGRNEARTQRDVATAETQRAEQESRIAAARQLAAAATADVDVDPERSVLLALAAIDVTRSAGGSVLREAEEALHRAVIANRIELRVPDAGGTVDWSEDGSQFVTHGRSRVGMVEIHDASTGEVVQALSSGDADLNAIALSTDATMLATTGNDGAARVWSTKTGEELYVVRGRSDAAFGPSFSADGSRFAAAWPDEGVVRTLELTTGQVEEITSVPAPLRTSFAPNGERLAVSSMAEELKAALVVDLTTGELLALTGHEHALEDVAWSPDGGSIATTGVDGSARIFDADTGARLFTLIGHRSHVADIDWSPDASRVVTASADGTAKVWAVSRNAAYEVATLSAHDTRGGLRAAAFSPDGTRVVTGAADAASAIVWDVSMTGDAEVANVPTVMLFYPAAAFAADGSSLFVTGARGSVTQWDGQTFTGMRTLGGGASGAAPRPPAGEPPIALDETDFTSLAPSPDGELVAALRLDGSLHAFRVDDGRTAFTAAAVGSTAWSPDGQLLAAGGFMDGRGIVTIHDRSGDRVTVVREEPGFGVRSVAFTADGAHLVTTRDAGGGPGSGVVIWDWRTGQIERVIDRPALIARTDTSGDHVAIVVEAPNDTTGAMTPTAEIWSISTGERVVTLMGLTAAVLDVDFSGDGSRLAVAGADGTVSLWDARTGEHVLSLRGHIGLVSDVSFGPDGTRLASASADGSVRVWALDLGELIRIARQQLTRGLTADECQTFADVLTCPDS